MEDLALADTPARWAYKSTGLGKVQSICTFNSAPDGADGPRIQSVACENWMWCPLARGSLRLCTVWTDVDAFSPCATAFYYSPLRCASPQEQLDRCIYRASQWCEEAPCLPSKARRELGKLVHIQTRQCTKCTTKFVVLYGAASPVVPHRLFTVPSHLGTAPSQVCSFSHTFANGQRRLCFFSSLFRC